MSIDWNHFTPFTALAGGVLIGIAAAMFVLLNGRIAGISGVLGGLLRPVAGISGVLGGLLRPVAGDSGVLGGLLRPVAGDSGCARPRLTRWR